MENCASKYSGCLYYSANALARNMTRLADKAFIGLGMSSSYAFLLMTANEKPGIQPKEICQYLQLSPSTVTRLIEKMEYKGLLKRKKVGRKTEVYPTKNGLAIQSDIIKAWNDLNDRYTSILGMNFSTQLTTRIHDANLKFE
ncbi:MAG: MarR family winged helix-turn-helix transcriptional regulator [Bacteroidia bacterium]|nr:MarR family winged helix-turn-helix transcriptional regulator [Bacteroidia bacterium]